MQDAVQRLGIGAFRGSGAADALVAALMGGLGDTSPTARKAYVSAAAQLCPACEPDTVRALVERVLASMHAQFASLDARMLCAHTIRELARLAPDALRPHFPHVLPAAFMGRRDADMEAQRLWHEAWEDMQGPAAGIGPWLVRAACCMAAQRLPCPPDPVLMRAHVCQQHNIIADITVALRSNAWGMRAQAALCIQDALQAAPRDALDGIALRLLFAVLDALRGAYWSVAPAAAAWCTLSLIFSRAKHCHLLVLDRTGKELLLGAAAAIVRSCGRGLAQSVTQAAPAAAAMASPPVTAADAIDALVRALAAAESPVQYRAAAAAALADCLGVAAPAHIREQLHVITAPLIVTVLRRSGVPLASETRAALVSAGVADEGAAAEVRAEPTDGGGEVERVQLLDAALRAVGESWAAAGGGPAWPAAGEAAVAQVSLLCALMGRAAWSTQLAALQALGRWLARGTHALAHAWLTSHVALQHASAPPPDVAHD